MVSNVAAERFLNSPFLADLDPAARQAVLEILVEKNEKAGTILLEQHALNDRIFFLIQGTVAVERNHDNGRVEWVLNLTAPTAFGETSFFQRKPQIVSVRAVTDIHCLILDRDGHETLRKSDPRASEQLAQAAIRVLAEHFDLIDQRVAEILARQSDSGPEETEWSRFRARLFSESKF